jgi:hypothetical protein
MINPRSKMTLYTLNDYQNRSARILSRFGKKMIKYFKKLKFSSDKKFINKFLLT